MERHATPALPRPIEARWPAFRQLDTTSHAALRIGVGFLLLQHGLQKLFGFFGDLGGVPGEPVPFAPLMGMAGTLELLGGVLLVVGLFTRPVAIVLLGEMVVAYLVAHAPNGPWPITNGGELVLLYGLAFYWLAAHGGGPASLDDRWHRPRASRFDPARH